ncbi:MAG: manganese efflux pump [Chloroflexi bacterium]|nr:manganese efflux pump [Chloroflexota bacterium]
MDLLSIVLVAVGLSMDCLAVAIAGSISMQTISFRQLLRISFAFGLFQFGMLVGGWYAGQAVVEKVESYDHWVAFGLLLLVGGRMIWESFESEGKQHKARDITKGLALLTLAIATSIDSLGVGLSLAFVESRIWLAAIIVGCVAFLITGAGFFAGRRIGTWLGRWADLVGGLVLIGIGVRIILEHLL